MALREQVIGTVVGYGQVLAVALMLLGPQVRRGESLGSMLGGWSSACAV